MWILDPFPVDPTEEDVALPSHLESQLLEVSTDSTLKLQWGKLDLGSFWIAVSKENPCLALRADSPVWPQLRPKPETDSEQHWSLCPVPPRLDLIMSEAHVSH
ncbi:hypothetical protein VZT92_017524 [Zoarces viviparus]|uniref:Uncharacterized protein n=1 Tax=Zoarces viviparus TaxID=48416 RepID=A0AAW1ESN7_ZOAVI